MSEVQINESILDIYLENGVITVDSAQRLIDMNKIYITLLLLFFASTISANSLTHQADSAYTEDNFVEAISLYNKIIQEEGTSSILYYNLGNSYFRSGKLGKAIICYERSVILDPSNEDAITNLDFVRSQITDKPGDNGTWIYFDYVPGEMNVREGKADYTGKLCVIGSKLNEKEIEELFA